MTDPQTKTIEFLKGLGYEIVRECLWPILSNPATGKRIQVAFDGRQVDAGYEGNNARSH